MSLEFPDDRTAWTCDMQFMLGSSECYHKLVVFDRSCATAWKTVQMLYFHLNSHLQKFYSGILVAPVFDDSGRAEVYLPAGKWTNFWSDEVIHGPRW